MKLLKNILSLTLILASLYSTNASAENQKLRVLAYNVACGQWATPQQIGKALQKEKPDVVFLNEVPTPNEGLHIQDWSKLVAKELEMKYVYVGTISSANHKAPQWGDVTGKYGGKFKSILSKTALTKTEDIQVNGKGWGPASAVRTVTKIGNIKVALYSLHLPGRKKWEGSTHQSLAKVINTKDPSGNIIVAGDFNEITNGAVMSKLQEKCSLTNAITKNSIDHILYRFDKNTKASDEHIQWGPKAPDTKQKTKRENRRGYLSDHPWVAATFEISSK